MNTPSSGNDLTQRRRPEILQRSSSHESRVPTSSRSPPSLAPRTRLPNPASSHDSPISPDSWGIPSPTSSNQHNHNHAQHQRHSEHPGRQHSMIGPTSAFYEPDQALAQSQESNYQQWVEAYGSAPTHYTREPSMDTGMQLQPQSQFHPHRQETLRQPHRQDTLRPQQHMAHTSANPAPPLQNQYQFVSEHYAPPASTSVDHFMSSAGHLGPPSQRGSSIRSGSSDYLSAHSQPTGPMQGAIGYGQVPQASMNNDMYYYPSDLGTADPTSSYGFTTSGGGPVQYSSPEQQTNYTPASDLHTLPPHASISPPFEGRGPQNYGAGSSGPQPQRQGVPPWKRDRVPTKKATNSRKRPRKVTGGDSDSDSDEDGFEVVQSPTRDQNNMPTRLPGACTHCKKLKMKCDFPKNENTCKRCKAGGHQCIVEGRKPRTAPNKREYLLAQIRQKDTIIESLLKQLHNPYLATPLSIASYRMATSPSDQNNRNIIAWLDRLQESVRTAGIAAGERAFKLGSRVNGDSESEQESDSQNEDFDDADEGSIDMANAQNLPDATVPLGLIANLSLGNTKAKAPSQAGDIASTDTLDDDNVGVANETYFMPGPATDLGIRAALIEQHSPPEILVHGLVVPEDVDKLFDIFYSRINAFIGLLDPALHTPASTFARCPFLFTVICAVASRYYSEKSEIYPIAMHFAKHAAANALIDGWKSVELAQAYILMSIYAVPAKRWEEDRSWLYTGLAIRIATDLNLHQVSNVKPQNEIQEREVLNRTRVWMICCNLDRSTSTQFGKPSTIKEDYIMRNSADWYKKSQFNHQFDVHLCAYAVMLRVVAAFHSDIFSDPNSPTGLNKNIDFRAVTLRHDENLIAYHEEWARRFQEDSDPNDQSCAFRCTLLPFLTNYQRLVMFSFGFQQAYQRGFQPGDEIFFTKCCDAAKAVIREFVESLAPSGYMRYSADGHFVFSSFASAFLLKLLRPEFAMLMTRELETEIFELIGRLIQTFSSPEIAIDDRHTPKLYARFLASLLARSKKDGATVGRLHQRPPPQSDIALAASTYASHAPSTSTNPSFPARAPEGETQGGQSGGYSQGAYNMNKDTTPIYQADGAYGLGNDPVQFGNTAGVGELALDGSAVNGFSDEEMLATMQALKNPQWWTNMMMPGFSWPETQTNNIAQSHSLDSLYSQNIPGIHYQGFAYQPTEIS